MQIGEHFAMSWVASLQVFRFSSMNAASDYDRLHSHSALILLQYSKSETTVINWL